MRPLLLASAALSVCCATRPLVGRGAVRAAAPLINSQQRTDLPLSLEDGRVIAGADFTLPRDEDGCLRGTFNWHPATLCPDAADPHRYVAADAGLVSFSTSLRDGGKRLRVTLGRDYADVVLDTSPLSEGARKYPALIGGLFAYGVVPPARGGMFVLVQQ